MEISDTVNEHSSLMQSRTTSGVLRNTEKVIENEKLEGKCESCGQLYSSNETASLKHHLENICPFRDSVERGGEDFVEFDQGVFREKVAKAIIRHNYPFKFVEHDAIREVFSYLNPKVQHLSRHTSKSDVLKIYEAEKEKLKETLEYVPSRICLTSGLRSSWLMVMTAHYVDNNWVLQRRVLVFRHLPRPHDDSHDDPHDGQTIGENLISFLQEWGIERKIFTVTLDNTSHNNGVIDLLKNHLCLKDSLLCNGQFMHVRCGAHIFNLVIQSSLNTIDSSVEKVRESVKYVRGSKMITLKFVDCVNQLRLKKSKKLVQDMPFRWTSTYQMLESALLYECAFQQLKLVDVNYEWCPSSEEWGRVEKIVKFLRPFFEMTKLFSRSRYPTANLYFPNVWKIKMLIQDQMRSDDPVISSMAKRMSPKFNKYWESSSNILSFALVLDPRYKFRFVEFAFNKRDPNTVVRKIKDLREQMHDLFENYLLTCPSTSTESSSSVGVDTETSDIDEYMEEFDAFEGQLDATRRQSQLEKYLNEPLLDRRKLLDFDVLNYWKENVTAYPDLARMARDILSIPITSVNSESTCSYGGRIIGKFQNSMFPENAEAIVCCRDWLEAYDSEDEEIEEELSTDI